MDCIILAAGRGTRMGILTDNCPKPMLEIHGKPKLAWNIEMLPDEITRVILVVAYLQQQIRDYFGNAYAGREIIYIEQKELNGTDGAVRAARGVATLPLLVINGDDFYVKSDLEKLISHQNATLCYRTDGIEGYGLVDVDDSGRFSIILDKACAGKPGLVYAGASVLNENYFDTAPMYFKSGETGIPHTQLQMKERPKVIEVTTWMQVGNPEQLEQAKNKIGNFLN